MCVVPRGTRDNRQGPCVDADGQGAFTVPRFQALRPEQEICATVKPDAPGLEPRTRCVPYDPQLSGNTIIDFANLR